jgi:hypothetical protein
VHAMRRTEQQQQQQRGVSPRLHEYFVAYSDDDQ